MILIARFQRFFGIFRNFSPHPQIPFPLGFFEDFFSIKQDTFLILKLLITFLKDLVVSQGSFSTKCTGLFKTFQQTRKADDFCSDLRLRVKTASESHDLKMDFRYFDTSFKQLCA